MQTIDMGRLRRETARIAAQYQGAQPFKFTVIDGFLKNDAAMAIHGEYPVIDPSWQSANGLHTRGKFTTTAMRGPMVGAFFDEINSPEFLSWLGEVTGIKRVLRDPSMKGAGYHQILDGGFLNVHVDFNKLTEGLDRRLNLIVYFNQQWKPEYGGFLELWDMQRKARIENISPEFNRCVLFETNEISFHGHPVPLNTGGRTTRKSLSVYYYTAGRDDITAADTHNTLYVTTQGPAQAVRVFFNGVVHAGRKLLSALRH